MYDSPTVRQMRECTGTGALEGSTMHCVWPGAFCFGKRDLKCILNKWRLESVTDNKKTVFNFCISNAGAGTSLEKEVKHLTSI